MLRFRSDCPLSSPPHIGNVVSVCSNGWYNYNSIQYQINAFSWVCNKFILLCLMMIMLSKSIDSNSVQIFTHTHTHSRHRLTVGGRYWASSTPQFYFLFISQLIRLFNVHTREIVQMNTAAREDGGTGRRQRWRDNVACWRKSNCVRIEMRTRSHGVHKMSEDEYTKLLCTHRTTGDGMGISMEQRCCQMLTTFSCVCRVCSARQPKWLCNRFVRENGTTDFEHLNSVQECLTQHDYIASFRYTTLSEHYYYNTLLGRDYWHGCDRRPNVIIIINIASSERCSSTPRAKPYPDFNCEWQMWGKLDAGHIRTMSNAQMPFWQFIATKTESNLHLPVTRPESADGDAKQDDGMNSRRKEFERMISSMLMSNYYSSATPLCSTYHSVAFSILFQRIKLTCHRYNSRRD